MKPMLPTSPLPPAGGPTWRRNGALLKVILVMAVVAGSAVMGFFVGVFSIVGYVRWLRPGYPVDFMYGAGDYGTAGMVLGAVIGTALVIWLRKRLRWVH
jgi:hypothetical protein